MCKILSFLSDKGIKFQTDNGSGLCRMDVDERGIYDRGNVVVDVELLWPLEADNFLADYSKAKKVLGWKPKTKFKELVKIMIESDMNRRKG